jgi:hypothetical protein
LSPRYSPSSLPVLQHVKGNSVTQSSTQPEYGRVPQACHRYGLSRSRLYLLAGEGLVRFVKVGNATLVDLESVRTYLASCPAASVRAPRAA